MRFTNTLLGCILKLVFGAVLIGSIDGILFPILIDVFSTDQDFAGWELLVVLVVTVFVQLSVVLSLSRIAKIHFNFTQFKFLLVSGTLTLILPLLTSLFGSTGNEPIWQFILLGIVGCLFWSSPLVFWLLISRALKARN